MKRIVLLALVVFLVMGVPAYAQTQQNKHALGDMYTAALNMIEACGMLNTLEPPNAVTITDIHMDHGQVLVTLLGEHGKQVVVYDPIANVILTFANSEDQPSGK